MKRIFGLLTLFLFTYGAQSQDNLLNKSGWKFGGALPTITFDTDLGFQYGALVDLYHYGDGSRFPGYDHKLYFEVSRFTRGSGINRFYYDSDRLIKGFQTTFDLSYLTDQAYDFYGFNGYDAVVNTDWLDSSNPNRMFYKYDRNLFRMKLDIQGRLSGDHFRWIGGFNLQHFDISSVDFEKLNKDKGDDEKLNAQDGLFEKYQSEGIIAADEASGGFVPALKAGLVYDSRDNRPNPMKGIWTEAVIEAASDALGAQSSFAKLAITHRQYFTLIPDDLSLVYRLAYQTTLAGDVPFYYQTQVVASVLTSYLSEGLGGAKTLRGIYRNRVVGDGFFFGNLEMRWKFVRFNFINNNFYLGLNGFTDFGQVTKKIPIDPIVASRPQNVAHFNDGSEKMHVSYGAGLRIVMNENFIISIDYGRATHEQDGKSGMYIGLNYLF